MSKISELPSATTYSGSDLIPIVQGGVTRKITAANLVATAVNGVLDEIEENAAIQWRAVPGAEYNVTPVSPSVIATTNADVKPGVPVRYVVSAVSMYGIVTAVSSGQATIQGPAISGTITSFATSSTERVRNVVLHIPGSYAATTGNKLASVANRFYRWLAGEARLVSFQATHITAATTTQPKINMMIGANAVSTNDSNLGIQLGAGSAHVVNAAGAVSVANYGIAYGDFIEVNATAAGVGATAAQDLTVHAVFVLV